MYMRVRSIYFACFYDVKIRFWNYFDSVILVIFHFMINSNVIDKL